MNDNVYGFDFNMNSCYHIDDFNNYISKEFSNSANNALSEILSSSTMPMTSSIATSTMTPSHQSNITSYSHCGNPNLNLSSSSLNSSNNSSNNSSPASSSVASPLSSSSSSCISITSVIDFQKLKTEITNNIVKPKSEVVEKSAASSPLNLSSFSICQPKIETQSRNGNQSTTSCSSSIRSSHEFTDEEKEQLQIAPFLSSVSENYCDITEYLTLPQNQAAKKLQMRPSTFSKRWKEASRNRKWPWRNVRKIDKEITCILHNMPKTGQLSEEVESHLTTLLKQRQEELKPVVIRIS